MKTDWVDSPPRREGNHNPQGLPREAGWMAHGALRKSQAWQGGQTTTRSVHPETIPLWEAVAFSRCLRVEQTGEATDVGRVRVTACRDGMSLDGDALAEKKKRKDVQVGVGVGVGEEEVGREESSDQAPSLFWLSSTR